MPSTAPTNRQVIAALRAPLAGLVLAVGVSGCGTSSQAPGVVLAPSAGATAPASTTQRSTSSTLARLPAALNTKPRVTVPDAPSPTTLKTIDLIKGTGPTASPASTVTVQYVGVLYKSRRQFDASWNDGSGQPVALPLSHSIPGWQQGVPGMRVGGRRELIIPAALAYGRQGRPPSVPPNAALVFVIDLHAIS